MKIRYLSATGLFLLTVIIATFPSTSTADIHAYDDNNQYLGILMYMDGDQLNLFIPSLGGSFIYGPDYSGWCGDELEAFFESSNCSGTAYARDPFPLIFDFSALSMEGHYKVDYSGKKEFTPGSYYAYPCVCQQNISYPDAEYYPFVQVQLPFTTPVALPLHFKVRSNAVVIPLN
jgi:hypothetical protein